MSICSWAVHTATPNFYSDTYHIKATLFDVFALQGHLCIPVCVGLLLHLHDQLNANDADMEKELLLLFLSTGYILPGCTVKHTLCINNIILNLRWDRVSFYERYSKLPFLCRLQHHTPSHRHQVYHPRLDSLNFSHGSSMTRSERHKHNTTITIMDLTF